MTQDFQSSDYKYAIPSDMSKPFDITCSPSTDLWRAPPSTDRANTPFMYRTLKLSEFKSAKVTVSCDWERLYDQGGLTIIVKTPGAQKDKWIKCGVEMEGKPRVSVVATDVWSDWSLHPVINADKVSATIEFVVQEEKKLMATLYGDDGEKYPLREVTWWAALPEDAEVKVGVAVARPSKEEGELVVHFSDLKINE